MLCLSEHPLKGLSTLKMCFVHKVEQKLKLKRETVRFVLKCPEKAGWLTKSTSSFKLRWKSSGVSEWMTDSLQCKWKFPHKKTHVHRACIVLIWRHRTTDWRFTMQMKTSCKTTHVHRAYMCNSNILCIVLRHSNCFGWFGISFARRKWFGLEACDFCWEDFFFFCDVG